MSGSLELNMTTSESPMISEPRTVLETHTAPRTRRRRRRSAVCSVARSVATGAITLGLAMTSVSHAPVSSAFSRSPDEEVEVVRLLVGKELVLVLDRDSFDETGGIDATRVDDGAHIHLQWSQIHPDDALRVRASFGFLPDEPEPITIEAERFVFGAGVELVGVIESQNAVDFTLRFDGKVSTFPWSSVRRRTPMRVDALEVYDAETLYADEFARKPPQSALDHYNLALYCEGIEAWEHVAEHLDEARNLDADLKRGVLESKRKRAQGRLQAGADAEILQAAERLASHESFDQALIKIAEFLAEKPGSPLRSDFEGARKKIETKRAKWLVTKVNSGFFSALDRTLRDLATSEQVTLNDARKEVDRNATKVSLERVAEQLNVPLADVESVWFSADRPKGSPRTASYGSGTFTLGEQAAFEGMEKMDPNQKEAKKEESGGAQDTNDVQERIKRLLEERQRRKEEAERGGPQRKNSFRIADVGPDKDEWWTKVATSQEKRSYLLAYWAERDEHVRLLGVSPRSCPRCGGEGQLRSFSNTGADLVQPCERCKGLRIDRSVKFN